jgi:TM2 domain-containing membrane protein YozV
MYCQFCGREIADGSKVCIYCGKNFDATPVPGKIYRHEFTKLKPITEEKNPKVAALLGFLLGWILLGPVGYIYLGQWNWFWVTFVIQIFAYPLTLFIAYPLLPIVFAIHQYQMASELNLMAGFVKMPAQEAQKSDAGDTGAGVD